jgi:hypothetical protein
MQQVFRRFERTALPSGRILDQVVDLIIAADLFIGDITNTNPNVFYEIGLRHMTAKPSMLIARRGVQIPFDLAGYRVFMYSDEQDNIITTRDALQATIGALLRAGPSAGSPLSLDRLRALRASDRAQPTMASREVNANVSDVLAH